MKMDNEKRIEGIEMSLNLINVTIEDMVKRLNSHIDRIQSMEKILFNIIKTNDLKIEK